MDTPKQVVHCFVNFPPEVWACVVCYLPGEQLGRLKITGATTLWCKLNSRYRVKVRNGGQISAFHLIRCLPKLQIRGSTQSARLSLENHFSAQNISTHFPQLEVLDLTNAAMKDYAWMNSCPPSLTKLTIYEWYGNVDLPPFLIHLEITYLRLGIRSKCLKLPSGLETLTIDVADGFDLLSPFLPPSLRLISVSRRSAHPSTLLAFIPNQRPDPLISIPFPEMIPPNVTKLRLYCLPCSTWPTLPSTVQTLIFDAALQSDCTFGSSVDLTHPSTGTNYTNYSIPFDLLPRSVTHFQITSGPDFSFSGTPCEASLSSPSYFPPQLATLQLGYIQLSPDSAKLLPSTLTHLNCNNLCERVVECLPEGLKVLFSGCALVTPNMIKKLPKSITSLKLARASVLDYWNDYYSGELLKMRDHPEFTTQNLCAKKKFWTDIKLPPDLVCLALSGLHTLGDFWIANQQFPHLVAFEDSKCERHQYADLSIFQNCPHLTLLDLGSAKKIRGKDFRFLPRSLEHLDLGSASDIHNSNIQHLPRTLKTLVLGAATRLTDKCIPDLPPLLEFLSLTQNSKITQASFQFLPYPIRSSRFDLNFHLKKYCAAFGEFCPMSSFWEKM